MREYNAFSQFNAIDMLKRAVHAFAAFVFSIVFFPLL